MDGVYTTPLIFIPITLIAAVGTSSGFWAWMQKREIKKEGIHELLVGLAHDRIIHLGMNYVQRGWLSRIEYIILIENMYEPYKRAGGNGLAEQIIKEVKHLPIREVGDYIHE